MTTFTNPFTGDIIDPTDVSYAAYTIAADTALVWPINGDTDPNVAARIMQITASASNLSLSMPPANQVSVGQDALIRNVGANTFTIKTFTGTTIGTVAAGEAKYIYVTDNSTSTGVWGIFTFGTGTSGADCHQQYPQPKPPHGHPDRQPNLGRDRPRQSLYLDRWCRHNQLAGRVRAGVKLVCFDQKQRHRHVECHARPRWCGTD